MKVIIVVVLLAILASLAGAGLFMVRKQGGTGSRDSRMARALAVRVGLSVALFLLVLLSWFMGWIQPNGLPMG